MMAAIELRTTYATKHTKNNHLDQIHVLSKQLTLDKV